MDTETIAAIQRKIGTVVDGIWGPKSKQACIAYLRSLCPNNPWPAPNRTSLYEFYGNVGENFSSFDVGGLDLRYEGKTVNSITCHERVGDSLLRVLSKIAATDPDILYFYAGCVAMRQMIGGSTPSLHARGAAIDLGVGYLGCENGMQDKWPSKSTMPFSVIEAFAREGWVSGGAYWGYDAMHQQATSWPA